MTVLQFKKSLWQRILFFIRKERDLANKYFLKLKDEYIDVNRIKDDN